MNSGEYTVIRRTIQPILYSPILSFRNIMKNCTQIISLNFTLQRLCNTLCTSPYCLDTRFPGHIIPILLSRVSLFLVNITTNCIHMYRNVNLHLTQMIKFFPISLQLSRPSRLISHLLQSTCSCPFSCPLFVTRYKNNSINKTYNSPQHAC